MNEEDMESEVIAFEAGSASLPPIEIGQHANDQKQLEAVTDLRERGNWSTYLLGLPDVWHSTKGIGVKVAVLDTGIDSDHPDLADAIVGMADFTGDGIEDTNGHGTHCAGIIGARLNGVGFVGAAPECDLLIGKVLGNDGTGSFAGIANGIDWAVDSGAHIISMSLGGPQSSPLLYRSVAYALAKGVHVICAAGNSGSLFSNNIGYPGQYGGVITVAAHDGLGNPSGFSSRGGEIDFMGPGQDIWSTYRNGSYQALSGTSMAAPFVAGISALIVSKHLSSPNSKTPIFNVEDLRSHLLPMASHPGHHDNARGYGPLLPFLMAARPA